MVLNDTNDVRLRMLLGIGNVIRTILNYGNIAMLVGMLAIRTILNTGNVLIINVIFTRKKDIRVILNSEHI